MNAQNKTRLALGIGALVLVLSIGIALRTGIQAWRLNQHINTAANNQDTRNDERIVPQNYLVLAPSHGAAGAALLARLRTSARQAGVSLQRAEPRPADPSDPQSVKISAQASGTTRAIAAFLYEIEASPPALLIERARLNADGNDTVSVDILVAARAEYEKNPL